MLGSLPFSWSYSLHSFRRAEDRPLAVAALIFSAVQFLALAILYVLALTAS
jgi:hypothetical protein